MRQLTSSDLDELESRLRSDECGNPIALARLRAEPTVLTCADCQRSIDAKRGGALTAL